MPARYQFFNLNLGLTWDFISSFVLGGALIYNLQQPSDQTQKVMSAFLLYGAALKAKRVMRAISFEQVAAIATGYAAGCLFAYLKPDNYLVKSVSTAQFRNT